MTTQTQILENALIEASEVIETAFPDGHETLDTIHAALNPAPTIAEPKVRDLVAPEWVDWIMAANDDNAPILDCEAFGEHECGVMIADLLNKASALLAVCNEPGPHEAILAATIRTAEVWYFG